MQVVWSTSLLILLALPHTIPLPDSHYNLITFVPSLELPESMHVSQRQKLCAKYRSFVVAGDKALLFCADEKDTIRRDVCQMPCSYSFLVRR